MRLVTEAAQVCAAVQSARSEAQSAFGSGELLLERALLRPRHVEVQVFADTQGHCIHLGERDCSVQRRHQKIIEETPSPAVDAQLRERMGRCAVELAQAAGYVGAGTVEFLVEGGEFFLMFLTMAMMAAATALIGILPTSAQIGLWAIVPLYLLKMVQGFSTGGEYAGATTYVSEFSPDRRRGFWSSWLDVGSYVGFAAGASDPSDAAGGRSAGGSAL
jgi:hypothetical protein